MPELKSCPFCGKAAVMDETDSPGERVFYAVACGSCNAMLDAHYWDDQEATAAWNTRAPSADPGWVMALRIALEPFAKAFHDTGDTSTDHWQLNQHTGLTYGDLRRAAGALAALRPASTKEQIRADRARFSDAAQKMGPK